MKHLLFDFGGVLVDLDKQRCIESFRKLGFDIAPFLGTYRQAGVFALFERGAINEEQFCDRIRQEMAGCEALPTNQQIIEAWENYLLTVPNDRLDMLLKLREKFEIHVLSNTNPVHWRMAEEIYFKYKGLEIGDFFIHVFLSYELGVEKPQPEIFQAVVDGIGCPADEILFFDDAVANCEAARQFGLQALLAPAGGLWLEDAQRLLDEA